MVPIGVQLYSLRSEPAASLPALLERLASLGYEGVEPAGTFEHSLREFRSLCDAVGLRIPSVHKALPTPGDLAAIDACLDEVARLGAGAWIVPEIPAASFERPNALGSIVDQLHLCARRAERFGLRVGYHNHEWEFELRVDGDSLHRALFQRLEPAISAEIDVYWAQVGGADPALEIERLGARAQWLHLKDGPAKNPDQRMTALGRGVVPLERILARSRAEWHIVEIDECDGDIWEALAESAQFLRSHRPGAAR